MFGVLDTIKLGAAALVAFLAGAGIFYQIGHWNGEDFGREAERDAARKRAMELIQERSKTNEEVSKLDVIGLCIELEGVWIPESSECR